MIPRALGWKKIPMFHVKEDGVELLSSIHNLRPPIHPLQPKDNELAQEWYILSSAYLNRFPQPAVRVNQNVQVHPPPRVPTTEERLLALESMVHSELRSLKDRVSTLEKKLQKLMEEKNEEVVGLENVAELHNLEGLCSSANGLGRKLDQIEGIVDPVDTRMRSVYSYLSDPCDDVLVDNLVLEDTAATGIGLCPKPPPVKEEAVYMLNKNRLGEILTQSDKQKPFISDEEFKKSHHYQRFRADLEARKRKSSFPWNNANVSKPSTHDQEEKFTAFKRGKPVEITRASLPGYTKKDFNKLKALVQSYMLRPVTPWIEDLTRVDPLKLYPVPGYQYWDLHNSGNLEGGYLSFSRNTIIRPYFWRSLLCLDHQSSQNGWLHDEHISVWVDYLNETRPPNADWCMVDSWFLPLLIRGDVSDLYGNGSRFKVSWSEARRVFIPINNINKHWTLGLLDIPTGVITIYDSYHGAIQEPEDIAEVVRMFKEVQIHLPLYLQRLGVFDKQGIDYQLYNITFEVFREDMTPRQGGLYGDCGVFLCIFLYRLSHGLDLHMEDPLQLAYRERMANLFIEHKECESDLSIAKQHRLKATNK